MNNKAIGLCLTAILIGMGSAFASLAFTQETPKMDVQLQETRTCVSLTNVCENSGAHACKIIINGVAYQAYKAGCVTLLKNTTSAAVITITDPRITTVYNPPL